VYRFRHVIREDHSRRAFLDLGDPTWLATKAEIVWGRKATFAGFELRDDDDTAGWTVFAAVPRVAAVWLTAGSWRAARWWANRGHGRRSVERTWLSVRVHDGRLWWEVAQPAYAGGSRGTPRWRYGNWSPFDTALGRPLVTTQVLVEGDHELRMPEGSYPVHVKIERVAVCRPRWRPRYHLASSIDVLPREGEKAGYVPVPGNIESDFYDGGDGIFGLSGGLDAAELGIDPCGDLRSKRDQDVAVHAALSMLRSSALDERRRRGAPADYSASVGS